jgi:hypothetical protein
LQTGYGHNYKLFHFAKRKAQNGGNVYGVAKSKSLTTDACDQAGNLTCSFEPYHSNTSSLCCNSSHRSGPTLCPLPGLSQSHNSTPLPARTLPSPQQSTPLARLSMGRLFNIIATSFWERNPEALLQYLNTYVTSNIRYEYSPQPGD